VMPEDTEELALTLNGKKRKINKKDFISALKSSELDDKIIENLFSKFTKAKDKWLSFIDTSFLPSTMKEQYKTLISSRFETLNR
jgi:serine/threonine-protein kinase HipA